METIKTVEEVLAQPYVNAYDLKIINPYMSYSEALSYIKKKRQEMQEKNYFVPKGKTKVALTKLVRKDMGV